MDDSPRDAVIRDLIERLRSQISGLVPSEAIEPMLERVRASARHLFADLELVPRSEMARHLETVQSLRNTVAALEQRVRALESHAD